MQPHSFIVFLIVLALPLNGFCKSYYDEQMALVKTEKEKNSAITLFDGDEEPMFPNLIEINKTINGFDANKNGIRDDLEFWINRTFKNQILRKQIKVYVKATLVQVKISEAGDVLELINSDKRSKERIELEKSEINLKKSFGCIMLVEREFKLKSSLASIHEMILNTSERKKLDMKVGQITSALPYPPIDPKNKECGL